MALVWLVPPPPPREQAASAAAAAAYAAASTGCKDIIPIVTPVEEVIAQGLVALAIAGDIIAGTAAADGQAAGHSEADEAYLKKNMELEAQLVDVERKLRLDRLYSSRPPKLVPRVYY